jgi:hypothetical protein
MVITGVKPAESECEVGETDLTCSVAAGRSNGSVAKKVMQRAIVLADMSFNIEVLIKFSRLKKSQSPNAEIQIANKFQIPIANDPKRQWEN